jgi:hypothetical protein
MALDMGPDSVADTYMSGSLRQMHPRLFRPAANLNFSKTRLPVIKPNHEVRQ